MPKMTDVTPYNELNCVLSYLVKNAQGILMSNFVGAYLQGSFAIGDFSEYSDCDFIVVIEKDLSDSELSALQKLHKDIQKLSCSYWHKNIEGSYAPKHILRRWSLDPRDPPGEARDASWNDPGMGGLPPRCYPFWYLNHGADTLVRSEHDNSQVVRWTLREKGVRISGTNIAELIDPVLDHELRKEVRATMDLAIASGLLMPMFHMQAFWVGLFCRILHTIETGRITSKKEAMTWAQESLDSDWQKLILHSLSLRKGDADQAGSSVSPEDKKSTQEFAQYCLHRADLAFVGEA